MARGSKHRIRRGAPWRECVVEDDNGCLVWQGGQGRVSRHCRACMCEAQRRYQQRKAAR